MAFCFAKLHVVLRLAARAAGVTRAPKARGSTAAGWEPVAREDYVGTASDAPQLERLERAWERELSNAYRLPGQENRPK